MVHFLLVSGSRIEDKKLLRLLPGSDGSIKFLKRKMDQRRG